MPVINFHMRDGTTKTVDAKPGLSVMEIAVQNTIPQIDGSCGGSLSCATCHAYIHPDWWDKVLPEGGEQSSEEQDMLDLAFDVRRLSRLTCQIIMRDDLDGIILALPGSTPDWLK